MRVWKFLIALLLLPACVALTRAAWDAGRTGLGGDLPPAEGRTVSPGPSVGTASGPDRVGPRPVLAFGAGYALWLAVFVLLPQPMRTYVLGHELTHALWALLMGARVSGLRVRKTGGRVMTTKTNWAIALAPYFFPFYALLFIALFLVAHWIWDLEAYKNALWFLVGLGWSFHVTFTLMMLLSTRQPDVQAHGALFSAVVIYSMNLLVMMLAALALSPSLHVAAVAGITGRHFLAAYGWTLDNLVALWQHLWVFASRHPGG